MRIFTRARRVWSPRPWVILWCGWLLLAGVSATQAYVLEGWHWPSDQPIILDLQLGSPDRTLIDGSTSWNAVAEAAMGVWNPYLGDGVQLEAIEDNSTPQDGDGKNSVFFSTTAYGEGFGDDALAVTLTRYDTDTGVAAESDVIFNSAESFDSYRGDLRTDGNGNLVYDLRRVAIHEFGHVLGLGHPPQGTVAIMDPVISNLDTVQTDDVAGVQSIYGPVTPAIISALNASGTTAKNFVYQIVAVGLVSSYAASGLPPGLSIDTATGQISGTPTAAGTYDVQISATNSMGTASATLVVVIATPPAITSSLAVTTPLDQFFSYRIVASGEPTSYAATGLPAALSVDPVTGVISGYAAVPGTYDVTLSAANFAGTSTATLVLKVTLTDNSLVTLHTFQSAEGGYPAAPPIQAADGNFYGATDYGGADFDGIIYKMTPDGTLTTLHAFGGADGNLPTGVVQGADGSFYGTTFFGGVDQCGTVFRLAADGTLTTLHAFSAQEGRAPSALIKAADGNFYGVTTFYDLFPQSTTTSIFKLTPAGVYSVIYSYTDPANGTSLQSLLQATDGNLYGLTKSNGSASSALFRFTPDGTFTVVHSFTEDAAFSTVQLFQARDGNFYGTTSNGGANNAGTIFELTPAGVLTLLHTFSVIEGTHPSILMQASDGNFYGTAAGGGDVSGGDSDPSMYNGNGTIFALTPDGSFATLYIFDESSGVNPSGGLVQGSDGYLYGVTISGNNSSGTIFRKGLVPIPTYQPPTVTLATTTPKVSVGSDGTGTFNVTLNHAPNTKIIVNYMIGGSAANGTDYTSLSGKVKFKPGQTSKTIQVLPLNDLDGATRTVKITLATGDGYVVGTTTPVRVKIVGSSD